MVIRWLPLLLCLNNQIDESIQFNILFSWLLHKLQMDFLESPAVHVVYYYALNLSHKTSKIHEWKHFEIDEHQNRAGSAL